MNKIDLIPRLQNKLDELFSRTQKVQLLHPKEEGSIKKGADITVSLKASGAIRRILVEVASSGIPRILREAARRARTYRQSRDDAESTYIMIGAPYISDVGVDLCKEEGIGCFDLTGNCFVSFDAVYIEMRGNKNLLSSTRPIQSLFSPKSSRIARMLLSDVNRSWKLQELAKEAVVSLGLASNIKQRLLDEELIIEEGKTILLKSPKRLLDAWVEHYRYKKNGIKEYYSLEDVAAAERRVIHACRTQDIPYALGLFSGASRVAPFVRFDKLFVFVDANLEALAKQTDLKPVITGANVALLRPYDGGVFYGSRTIDGVNVVSDVQLYLDLKTYKGRGEEAADFLYESKLSPEWRST